MNYRTFSAIILITLLVLFNSCEGIVAGSGKVVSTEDKSPVDSVRIKWRTTETYTDSLGAFEIEQFVGCPSGCPDLELILEKTGYLTKYVNLTMENKGKLILEGITIELSPSDKSQADIWNNKVGIFFYYFSMFIASLGLFSLIMLFILKVQNIYFWFIVIFFGTIAFHFNILTDSFDFKFFHPVTRVNPPHFLDPAWYKLNVPVGAIFFWIFNFRKLEKTWLAKKIYTTSTPM